MENLKFTLIDSLVLDYASIRKKTEMFKKRFPKYITGNDNYIGMIGEYWATRFLEDYYKNEKEIIKSLFEAKEKGEHNLSNEWSDFQLFDGNFTELISVKTIFENKSGESGEIKFRSFDKGTFGSIIIIKLDDSLFPTELLYIKDIEQNLKNQGERVYLDNWRKNTLKFRYYTNDKNHGFDNELSKFIYKFNTTTEKFEQ